METLEPVALKKARAINLESTFYGTFAEIGAGQEVARYFFVAGRASQTIAKSISAYDMTFSDSIYGKANRYVCEERVSKMLDHEFELLTSRLDQKRGGDTRFFVLADTVATSSHNEASAKCHGWIGIRFQLHPRGRVNDLILHVRMRDKSRLQQQEALGLLGVNLVHAAFRWTGNRSTLINELKENIGRERIEINVIRCVGEDVEKINERLLNLELVRNGLTEAVLFSEKGEIIHPGDTFFKKSVLIQRGTFRPVTTINQKLMESGIQQFQSQLGDKTKCQPVWELTMNSLTSAGVDGEVDFLERVDALCTLGYMVLLSKFDLFYQVRSYLRDYTDQPLAIIIGARHLEQIMNPEFYKSLAGGMLEGFSRLFDENTQLIVFPHQTANAKLTAKTFEPPGDLKHLYNYLIGARKIIDVEKCEAVDTAIHSADVRKMLANKDPKWESYVPTSVRDLIKKQKLFGYQ